MKNLLKKSDVGLFASQTLTGHLIRGVAAATLLYQAISQQFDHPAWALLVGILALVLMRGCPVCWFIGLVETIAQRLRRSS